MRGRSWWLSKGKNYAMSNANVLIMRFLTYSNLMKWVRAMPVSKVDLCLRPPNWHEWIKLLDIEENCNLSPIIFSKSLLVVLSSTMGQNNLGELYDVLLGLGMITIDNILKWVGQCPKFIQVLAISISLLVHSLFLVISLRCLQDNLSSPGVDKLLQPLMVLKSFFFEKETHVIISLLEISSNRLMSTWQFWAELKELWRVFQRSSSLIHGCPLSWIASVARRLLSLTQLMSSQGLHFLLVISSIFPLKKFHFVFLTVPLNLFQSLSCLDCLYMFKSLRHLSSHHTLECLVMLTTLECLCHILSILLANIWMMVSKASTLGMGSVLSLLME